MSSCIRVIYLQGTFFGYMRLHYFLSQNNQSNPERKATIDKQYKLFKKMLVFGFVFRHNVVAYIPSIGLFNDYS